MEASAPKKSKTIMYVIIAVVVIAAAIGGYMYWKSIQDKKKVAPKTPAIPTAAQALTEIAATQR